MPESDTNKPYLKCALHLMEQWPQFLYGVDRIYGFWQTARRSPYQGIEWIRDKDDTLLDIDSATQQYLEGLAGKNHQFSWINASQLPFAAQGPLGPGQLNLFNESQYLVLLVRVEMDREVNAFYFHFFRENKSNFGMTGSREPYTTSEKSIIGRMAGHYAHSISGGFFSRQHALNGFRTSTRQLLDHRDKQLEEQKVRLQNWQNQWLEHFLRELSQRDGFNYVIHKNARQMLFESGQSLPALEKSIAQSLVYICNLLGREPGDLVELNSSFLMLAPDDAPLSPELPETLNRISKTQLLLDRLEKSALIVIENGDSLTSAEVGKNMDKAITAPAISDALKKNKMRVLQLLNAHPEKWPTIRRYFKPVVNLYEKNKGLSRSS